MTDYKKLYDKAKELIEKYLKGNLQIHPNDYSDYQRLRDELHQLEAEIEKEDINNDFKCSWISKEKGIDCVNRIKKCHICTKSGHESNIKNYFAPYREPLEMNNQ